MYAFEDVLKEIFRIDSYYNFEVFVDFFNFHFESFSEYEEDYKNIHEFALEVIAEFKET